MSMGFEPASCAIKWACTKISDRLDRSFDKKYVGSELAKVYCRTAPVAIVASVYKLGKFGIWAPKGPAINKSKVHLHIGRCHSKYWVCLEHNGVAACKWKW